MTTPDAVSSQIRTTLATTIPGLSCALGTPERKIVDAVATAISQAYVSQYLVGSLLDIDTKSGLELEQFVGIFGFGRLQGQAATGVVTVTVNVASSQDQPFQLGSQFYTTPNQVGIATALYYASTSAVVLSAGDITCEVPVQCTTVGSNGNVPPDSIAFQGTVVNTATCTNLSPMTGGVDIETDGELRQRFKDTFLRNVTGTSDFYTAICQQNTSVSRVVVFGPVSLYSTQIVVPSTELVLPVNQDVKYAWSGQSSCFSGLGQPSEVFYSDVEDYTFVGGASPTFSTSPSGALFPLIGTVVDLEFQYTTTSSRNNPPLGITDKVDIYMDGVDPFAVQEASVITADVLSSVSTNPFYTGNFIRVGSTGSPTAGNRFQRLGSTPIVSFPATLTIGGVVYIQGTHYFLLQDATLLAGTQLETSGIEWGSSGPPTGTATTFSYVYNQIPELLNAVIGSSKQITTDVLVHQGDFVYIQPCLTVEYQTTYSVSVVNASIATQLQTFFSASPFGQSIPLSVLCMVVQQCYGVVSCSITTAANNPVNYGVQVFNNATDPTPAEIYTSDFKLSDNQIGNYLGVLLTRAATP
jgi:uncharacterized phage protein gp47/JayE